MGMTLKGGVADLFLGGGKASIRTKKDFLYTEKDHAAMDKVFVVEADKVRMLSPRVYSTASHLGTNEFDCDVIMREYVALHETELGSKRGVATGKSVEKFGNPARKKSTGRGGLIVAREILRLLGERGELSVAIDGFGNVGLPCFELAPDYGFHPVAVSDINGGIYNSRGLDVRAVIQYYKENKTFAGFKEADAITNEEILGINCGILVPASIQNRLTRKTASTVKTKYILELANDPTTDEGEKILLERGITIIPDILANAGGVIISWRELNVNKEHDRHTVDLDKEEEESNELLLKIMHSNTGLICDIAAKKQMTPRDAAWYLALSRLVPRLQKKHLLYL